MAVGVSSIASLAVFVVALIAGDPAVAILTAALTGACFGFLPYNFNPASIFMGDTGATFLGFILASVSVQGLFKSYAFISIAVPLLILGLPIFDTGFAIVRRIKNKQPIMGADRGHLHHRLIDMGLSQRQAVLVIYGICFLLAACAVMLTNAGALKAIVMVVVILAVLLFTGINYASKKRRRRDKPPRKGAKKQRQKRQKEKKTNMIKVMTVFGTRPEAIKMAPLVKALEACEETKSIVCVTAQHREMLDMCFPCSKLSPTMT